MNPLLQLTALHKEFPTPSGALKVLRGVDMSLKPGEIVRLAGASGSGKSSLINICGLLSRPTAGSVLWEGRPVSSLSDREQTDLRAARIGMVFQSHRLLPELTPTENVLVAALVADRARIVEALAACGIGAEQDIAAKKLSGGQQQRIAVVRALVNDPLLLLADEPISGLDDENAEIILDRLVRCAAEGGAVLIASHDERLDSVAHRRVTGRRGPTVIDWLLVRRGALAVVRHRLVALLILTVIAALTLSISVVVSRGVAQRSRDAATKSALTVIHLQAMSPRGPARPLVGKELESLRDNPAVADVTPWSRYGFSSLEPAPEPVGTPVWFLAPRIPVIQPPVAIGREPAADDEILVPQSMDGVDFRRWLDRVIPIEYTFMRDATTGEPRHRFVRIVGLFDAAQSVFDGDTPAYGRRALLTELAAAAEGRSLATYSSVEHRYDAAFVTVRSIEDVGPLTAELTRDGYYAESLAALANKTPYVFQLLGGLNWVLAGLAGVFALALGAVVGATVMAERGAEVGLLRAVGWSRPRVQRLLIGQMALIGGGCGAAAVVLGSLGSVALARGMASTKGLEILAFAGSPIPDPAWLFGVALLIPLAFLVGAWRPIGILAKTPPDSALREL